MKGSPRGEKNTTTEMSNLESYKTPPRVETTTERNNRPQRIHFHWEKKWFNYENVRRKYKIMFASLHLGMIVLLWAALAKTMKKLGCLKPKMLILTHSKELLIFPKKWKREQRSKLSMKQELQRESS